MMFWKNKKVFITGHTGFKGATLCRKLLDMGAYIKGYALEPSTSPNLFEIERLGEEHNLISEIGDVRDLNCLSKSVIEFEPEIIFHLAAQPLVLRSYEDPVETYEINVMGTVNILEAIRKFTSEKEEVLKSVLIVTTDKVYFNENNQLEGFKEDEKLCGFDPYSNSKSAAELVVYSYKNSFFKEDNMPAISTARAGNVIGFGDFSENRIIPDCIRAALKGESIFLRNPLSVRPYQHVEDCLNGYILLVEKQYLDKDSYEGCYNFGPMNEDFVNTEKIAELFKKHFKMVDKTSHFDIEKVVVKDAPYEAALLRLDSSKARQLLGWIPNFNIDQAVEKTVSDLWKNKKNLIEGMQNHAIYRSKKTI